LEMQMRNGSDVPDATMRLDGRVRFRSKTPTYRAPRIGGLMNAR
jgi:hypothetical protein